MTPVQYMLSQLRIELEVLAAVIKVLALLMSLGVIALFVITLLFVVVLRYARLVVGESRSWRDARIGIAETNSWMRSFSMPATHTQPDLLSGRAQLHGAPRSTSPTARHLQ